MTPKEFYALPNQESRPWYDASGRVDRFFDDPDLEYGLDESAGREAGADALVFERKLFANVDGERTVSYTAVRFGDLYVGLIVTAGRGERDQERRIVTDEAAYKAARGYLDRFMVEQLGLGHDLADPGTQAEVLGGFYHHVVLAVDGETRLVDVAHVDDAGNLLFDERAYDAAFDRIVRPAFGRGAEEEMRQGIVGKRMQELVARAVMESMPAGVEATDDFAEIPDVEGLHRYQKWSPVLVAGGDATYSIGVESFPNWFVFKLTLEKVGPPELYAELARKASPAP